MAFNITTKLIDNQFEIKIEDTDGTTTTYAAINKEEIQDVVIEGNEVCIYMTNEDVRIFKFDYRKVTLPVVANVTALYNAINTMINNRP